MRIALIAPPWVPVPPPKYGGTELVLDTLARGLQSSGHEVLLCTTGDSECPVPVAATREMSAGTDAISPAVELCHVIEAYEHIRAWRADIVHDHTLAGPLYSVRFDVPVVTTNHGPFDVDMLPLYRVIGASRPVIAISQHHASTAADVPIAAVIHHGLDASACIPGRGEGGYALFLGRMHPTKGVHRAASIARAAGVPLKIAAKCRESGERDYFEQQVEPLLGGAIEYVGEVSREEKMHLLAEASCLLNPVDWPEPFGMVMAEALTCGTPVVARRRGAAPEIVHDGVTGFVRETDEELVEVLRRVHQLDRERCRADALERFSAERMVTDHISLYRRTVDDLVATGLTEGQPTRPEQSGRSFAA
jgi:glycosyltransferase involved in cell wall biosynthesis